MSVSIIVPIYNSEKYLKECIESILCQSYENLELILVNDGSVDKSADICKKFALKDKRIKFIDKENTGVSNSRNVGLANAKNKYIMFVDSDDMIERDTLYNMLDEAEKNNADIVFTGYKKLLNNGKLVEFKDAQSKYIAKDKQAVGEIYNRMLAAQEKSVSPISQSACMKLYLKEIIVKNSIKFIDIKKSASEDFLFNMMLIKKANTIVVLENTYYIYRENIVSYSNSFDKNRIFTFINLYNILEDEVEDKSKLSSNIIGGISVCVKQLVASQEKDKLEKLKEILENEAIKKILKQCKIKNIKFPLSLFCFLMKYEMKWVLYILIRVFIVLKR